VSSIAESATMRRVVIFMVYLVGWVELPFSNRHSL
jgi:hypothetical protein